MSPSLNGLTQMQYEKILEAARDGTLYFLKQTRTHVQTHSSFMFSPIFTGTYRSINADVASATGYNKSSSGWSLCPLSNVTLCAALETAQPTVVMLYNALGQAAPTAPIRLSVGMPTGITSWAVQDGSGAPVLAQIVPLSSRDAALRMLYNGSTVPVQVRGGCALSTYVLRFIANNTVRMCSIEMF